MELAELRLLRAEEGEEDEEPEAAADDQDAKEQWTPEIKCLGGCQRGLGAGLLTLNS